MASVKLEIIEMILPYASLVCLTNLIFHSFRVCVLNGTILRTLHLCIGSQSAHLTLLPPPMQP